VTPERARSILKEVKYKDWSFLVIEVGDLFYLQVCFYAPDMKTHDPSLQRGRKWHLSHYMTKSEVVCTAMKAVLTAEEHEARESFRYRGRTVFGPHLNIDALWETARFIDVRDDPEAEARKDGV